MGDNENLLSISQKLLKKISNRNLSDNNSDSGSSISNMDSSPEITSNFHFLLFSEYAQLTPSLLMFTLGPQLIEQGTRTIR